MQNNRQITISIAGSRHQIIWQNQNIWWGEFVEKLEKPVRSEETLAKYLNLAKSQQDTLKDVGGFVGGKINGQRKNVNILGRDLITLDFDSIPGNETDKLLKIIDSLGCAYVVYSTRKHEPVRPRLRIIFPTDRTVSVEEYEPIARKLAERININMADPTTFQPARLMYWPSCCKDGQYVYAFGDKPFISADGILALYANWQDISLWSQVPGEAKNYERTAQKQGDPEEKTGIIGAFCKTYDIPAAIEKFINYAYTYCTDSRLTFTGGSTSGGAVIYEEGKFLFSNHATDPAGGKLCNAFDLVRLHKFGEMDDTAKPETPTNKLPSYKAMCTLALEDDKVAALLNKERYEKVKTAFGEEKTDPDGDNSDWISLLQKEAHTGLPSKTITNVRIVLENDPNLKDKLRMDDFTEFIMATGPLPWGHRKKDTSLFRWTDADDAGFRDYIQQILGFKQKDTIDDALLLHASENRYNPLQDFLSFLKWDKKKRLDTLFIDYLGAEDDEYMRTVTRKSLVGAVARALQPGVKYDYMPVLSGPQGIGKSTILHKIGLEWFSDSIKSFDKGKEAAELLQGVWVVELGEMEAYSRSDINAVKGFLSKQDDQYRAAYARKTEKHLRKCVFFGTTNDYNYLRDTTGNRRFWPIETKIQAPTKNVFQDLNDEEIAQIWAEAFMYWSVGETLFLNPDMEAQADEKREKHLDRDPLQGQIEEFLEAPIPVDWSNWSRDRRRLYWGGQMKGTAIETTPRDRVCAAEIWAECLGMNNIMPKVEAHRINKILEVLKNWERSSTTRFGGGYGTQKGFKRLVNHCKPSLEIAQNLNFEQNPQTLTSTGV